MNGAIFDVDGTLIDSMDMWMHFGSSFVRSYGIEADDSLDLEIRYYSLRTLAERFSRDYPVMGSADDIEAECRRRTEDFYFNKVQIKPGVRKLLEELRGRGVKMYLATATYRVLVEGALRRLGIWDMFDGILTCSDVGAGKDKPDIFKAALAALGTYVGDTWVFEDAMHAMLTAKSLGLRVCGVYDATESDHTDEIKKICDIYVDSFTELDTSRLI